MSSQMGNAANIVENVLKFERRIEDGQDAQSSDGVSLKDLVEELLEEFKQLKSENSQGQMATSRVQAESRQWGTTYSRDKRAGLRKINQKIDDLEMTHRKTSFYLRELNIFCGDQI